eukprot:Nk52_evm30s226 gene=Nk52_evmTU30s226
MIVPRTSVVDIMQPFPDQSPTADLPTDDYLQTRRRSTGVVLVPSEYLSSRRRSADGGSTRRSVAPAEATGEHHCKEAMCEIREGELGGGCAFKLPPGVCMQQKRVLSEPILQAHMSSFSSTADKKIINNQALPANQPAPHTSTSTTATSSPKVTHKVEPKGARSKLKFNPPALPLADHSDALATFEKCNNVVKGTHSKKRHSWPYIFAKRSFGAHEDQVELSGSEGSPIPEEGHGDAHSGVGKRKRATRSATLSQQVYLSKELHRWLLKCNEWDFNVFALHELTHGRALSTLAMHLFEEKGLIDRFNLDMLSLRKYFRTVEEGYRRNPYHNATHAADVLQCVSYFISQPTLSSILSPHEIFGCLLAAIIHDLDHPGVTNAFLVNTESPLCLLHGKESVLENHHCGASSNILKQDGLNIFAHMDGKDSGYIIDIVHQLVLATDMARHKDYVEEFEKRKNDLDADSFEDRLIVMKILVKCADVSNPCREPHLCSEWTTRIMREFFEQGDIERESNMTISMFMDRHTTNIPNCQAGFINFFVKPLLTSISECPWIDSLSTPLKHLDENLDKWKSLP